MHLLLPYMHKKSVLWHVAIAQLIRSENFFFLLVAICNNTGYFGFVKYKYHFEFSMTYLWCEQQKAAMKVIAL